MLLGTAGVGGAAALGMGVASPSAAAPPSGEVSACFGWGSDQTIPNATWTNVEFSAEIDNDDYLASTDPSEIQLVQGGLYTMAAEVAWSSNSTGVRLIRIIQGFLVIAQATDVGIGSLPGSECQHQQVYVQPGGTESCYVQVYQNSGASLDIKSIGISAPLLMVARLGDLTF